MAENSPASDPPAATPAVEPAATPADPDPGVDASVPGGPPVNIGDEPAPAAPATETPPGDAPADPPATAAKPKFDATARLASMSRDKREAQIAAKKAEREATEAKTKLADLDSALDAARKDPRKVKDLLARVGLDFRQVVDVYAEDDTVATPEQQAAKVLAETRSAVDELKKLREDDKKAADARLAEAKAAETRAGVAQAITKQAEKFAFCADEGDAAVEKVLGIVGDAWVRAGRPVLYPGEFDDAVQAAIEKQEEIYLAEAEKKAATLAKRKGQPAPAAAATNGTQAANGAAKPSKTGLPAGLVREDYAGVSDKTQAIIDGLIDRTAPVVTSPRAKPRTISSSLGGSAPPRVPADGTQDPRDALRDVLAPAS